jgi:molybdopterin synthase sulfur carrier subunit
LSQTKPHPVFVGAVLGEERIVIEVTVKLFATFRAGRFDVARREVRPGTTVAEIVEELRIPKEQIGILLIGGRHVELGHAPAAGATISIFPLVGGG